MALVGIGLAAVLVTAGCAGPDDADAPAEAGVVSGASLSPADFTELASGDGGAVVVDVRTPQEYAEGHLPNSLNIDVSAPDFADRVAQLDADATYAVYCRSGSRSRAAVDAMTERGLTAVDLAGGIVAWAADGRPVVTD